MGAYVVQRLLLGMLTLFGLSVVVFLLVKLALPYDLIDVLLADNASRDPALRETLERDMRLDRSLASQYLSWMGGLLQGDLGTSLYSRRSISDEVASRLPLSVELGVIGLTVSFVVAVPIGVISALKQDTWSDYMFRGGAILIDALPGFWIAILILTFGGLWFRWSPPLEYHGIFDNPIEHFKHIWVPSVLLGLATLGSLLRMVRTQMIEVLRQDYVRTARAKGLHERTVVYRHAFRNALAPVVTLIGIALPTVITGTVIFEVIFVLPGMGQYVVDAVRQLDYPVILVTNLLLGATIVLTNIVVDLSYAWIDPRIRYD